MGAVVLDLLVLDLLGFCLLYSPITLPFSVDQRRWLHVDGSWTPSFKITVGHIQGLANIDKIDSILRNIKYQ